MIRDKIQLFCYVCILLFAVLSNRTYGQSHGLVFASHEVVSDLRTSLNLSEKGPLCFQDDFELSFDLSFQPGARDYFGYVFRLIKNDRLNIDLIYEFKPVGSAFKIVVGDQVSSITFNIDSSRLFRSWTTLRLHFDRKNNRLILSEGDKTYTDRKVDLSDLACFRLIFGINHDKQFKTLDVPPMKIRNISLTQEGRPRYHWPLEEEQGNTAGEKVDNHDARVENPVWVRREHSVWKPVQSFSVTGPASTAFHAEKGLLYIVAADSLYTYSLQDNKLSARPHLSGPQKLLPGNQSLMTPDGRLCNIYTDQELVSSYSFAEGKWDRPYAEGPITDYWHVNKFFSPADTSVYVIGGYGHFRYKNEVQRYHLPSGRWEEVPVKGDRLTPRYLSALGTNRRGDTAWLIGGYGSASGQQIVNPQSLYDLVLFDVKNRTFKKVYDLEVGKEGFAFANSLVTDPATNSFYALVYPNDKYNSELQLIRGSLEQPSITRLGKKIPYHFHDINSFSDLFFSPTSNRFVAVTLTRHEHTSAVSIFTLADPPLESTVPVAAGKTGWFWWTVASILLLSGILCAGWQVRYCAAKGRRESLLRGAPALAQTTGDTGEPSPLHPSAANGLPDRAATEELPPRNTICLFGDMQLYDEQGEDITRCFSPLLKELFLLILLHTIRKGSGISSEKLNEILWCDKDEKSARNNRSVNIAKLKNILDRMRGCQVQKTADYWKMEIDNHCLGIDYVQYLAIVKDKHSLNKQKIKALSLITRRGSFLSNTEYEWLDAFKAEISNEVIDTYLRFAATLSISEDPEFLIQLASYIFYFDPVNEEAMVIKCKALAYLGKHSLAKQAYETFTREYRQLYGEDFDKDFHEVLNSACSHTPASPLL